MARITGKPAIEPVSGTSSASTEGAGARRADAPAGESTLASEAPFWETTALDDMTDAQWESLCDGCGRCCLQKLEDEDTHEVHFTNIACRLLDPDTCRCRRYENRFRHVPDCLAVRPLDAKKLTWLPATCAYRRLARGESLPHWHPLITGDPASVRRAGVGMQGRCTSEQSVPLELWVHRIVQFES